MGLPVQFKPDFTALIGLKLAKFALKSRGVGILTKLMDRLARTEIQ
jgi:hypothetical protein